MSSMTTELRDVLTSVLAVAPPDDPALQRLIESYRDIARELGRQHEVERMLRDILPPSQADAKVGAPHPSLTASRHSSRSTSPSQTSRKAPSR